MLFEINDGSVSRGGEPVLTHFSFEIRGTEKIAVVGRNGAGKTTLLETIAGIQEPDTNEKNPLSGVRRSRAFTVGILRQQTIQEMEETVGQLVLDAVCAKENSRNLRGRGGDSGTLADVKAAETGSDSEESAIVKAAEAESSSEKSTDMAAAQTDAVHMDVMDELYSQDRFAREKQFDIMLSRFGFAAADKSRKLGTFSGGEQKKILLIRLFMMQPDVLLLDEPTNHLDMESVQWLEKYLQKYRKAVVVVSHDRYFMDQFAEVVWEVSGQKLTRYAGNYTHYREQKAVNYAHQLKAYEEQQQKIRREKELIEKFKHRPRKASFAKSRKSKLRHMELIERPRQDDAVISTEEIVPQRRGSKWVYECEDLKIGYRNQIMRDLSERGTAMNDRNPVMDSRNADADGRSADGRNADADGRSADGRNADTNGRNTVVVRQLTFRIRRGQKIGVIGRNGTGKTTFLRTVAGRIPPLSGRSVLGNNIDIAFFDQFAAQIQSDKSVLDWFRDRYPLMSAKEIRDMLAGFLFTGTDLGKPVTSLSGGEKSRLVLASVLHGKPNFLILDEPTNNMDIPAMETLESIFRSYQGTILFVSHDRYFLSRVADALLIFGEGDAPVQYYPFGYDHYMERMQRAQSGEEPDLLRSAQEQRLIEGLRSVPRGESHRLREISTEQATRDWEFDLNRREREQAEKTYRQACEKMSEFLLEQAEVQMQEMAETQQKEPAEVQLQESENADGNIQPESDNFTADGDVYGLPGNSGDGSSGLGSVQENEHKNAQLFARENMREQMEEGKKTEERKQLEEQTEKACAAWTQTLLDWYDLWLETQGEHR